MRKTDAPGPVDVSAPAGAPPVGEGVLFEGVRVVVAVGPSVPARGVASSEARSTTVASSPSPIATMIAAPSHQDFTVGLPQVDTSNASCHTELGYPVRSG